MPMSWASIDREQYDIVGVTGNSMGWYLSLAAGGALSLEDGARLVNGMGQIMTEHGEGGQVVYPSVDEDWRASEKKKKLIRDVLSMVGDVTISTSIHLGGMHVFAGGDRGIRHLMSELPKEGVFPLRLRGHSAFHSPQLDHIVPMAKSAFARNIWPHFSTDINALYDYTLGRQINGTYDFTRAVQVAAKEYAFLERQKDNPIIISMGREDQRALALK